MSTRVDQLRALLSRVEERRKAPRLRAVPAAVAATPAPANEVRATERVPAAPERKPPASPTPLENAIAGGLAPTPVPGNKPSSMELDLDDFEAPQTAVSKAPAAPRGGEAAHRTAPTVPQTDPFAGDPFASAPPPAPAAKPAPAPAPAPAAVKAPAAAPAPAAAKVPAPAPARPAPTPPQAAAPAPTAPTARIAAPEPAVSAPVARAMTRARVETPRTFGELLDLSLSLRPRE